MGTFRGWFCLWRFLWGEYLVLCTLFVPGGTPVGGAFAADLMDNQDNRIFFTAASPPRLAMPDLQVETMVAQVNVQSLHELVAELSGEKPATIGGSTYTLTTRYSYHREAIQKAAQYVYEHFTAMGLQPVYQNTAINPALALVNVIAEQPGYGWPPCTYLLSAHMDSTVRGSEKADPMATAPGADDNASGTAALLMVAEILHEYTFSCGLRYAVFSGEEQGMLGSLAYAQALLERGERLEGVINLDMLAYNTPGSSWDMDLVVRDGQAGQQDLFLANAFEDVVLAYQFSLKPDVIADDTANSDHYAFWQHGYPAIMAIEGSEDFNPYYHTVNDRLEHLDFDFYVEFVRAVLAAAIHLASPGNSRPWIDVFVFYQPFVIKNQP